MRQLKRYAGLYWLFLLQRFKILMEYRVNFLIGASSTVFVQAAGLITIWVVMGQIPSLNGWSLDEVFLVYGLLTLAKSINHMFADNLWTIGRQYIRTGGFDRFLVRPINPLFHLLADRFCHDGIGNFLVGALLVWRGFTNLGIPWSPANIGYLALAVLAGGGIFIGLNLITCVASFWIMDSIPVTLAVFQTNEFAKFPLEIYRKSIGVVMTWLVPYGLTSFYPASYLLGRNIGYMAWAMVPVSAVLLGVGYELWKVGLKHYGSTGS
ncbi:MAG TPA: ABC-2 family transporter protein [Symbiobacteriaceae bacterium]|nr:ABC-2 family transporter protein [Symbiobacteriaceae bacterium]